MSQDAQKVWESPQDPARSPICQPLIFITRSNLFFTRCCADRERDPQSHHAHCPRISTSSPQKLKCFFFLTPYPPSFFFPFLFLTYVGSPGIRIMSHIASKMSCNKPGPGVVVPKLLRSGCCCRRRVASPSKPPAVLQDELFDRSFSKCGAALNPTHPGVVFFCN